MLPQNRNEGKPGEGLTFSLRGAEPAFRRSVPLEAIVRLIAESTKVGAGETAIKHLFCFSVLIESWIPRPKIPIFNVA